jgi:hypothetical protein
MSSAIFDPVNNNYRRDLATKSHDIIGTPDCLQPSGMRWLVIHEGYGTNNPV